MKSYIYSNCKGMLTNAVAMHHNNAQPHSAAVTTETFQKMI
jgi:hypothetical protein